MKGYKLRPRARQDLDEIWSYTVARWNGRQAEVYVREIQASIERVAMNPEMGRSCDDVRPGYRKIASGAHIIFYRTSSGSIDVVRILHSHMDVRRHL
jgi:toxin ParE1/3/4